MVSMVHVAPRMRSLAPDSSGARSEGVIQVVTVRLDVPPAIVESMARALSETERRRARRYVFERDRRRFIVRRGSLRHLLGSRLDVPPGDVEFVPGPHGKPALSRRMADPDLRFSASHTGDVAAVAVSRHEIGIDIEEVRDLPDADAVAARFFSPRENETYRALNPRDRPQGFFNCWTRKEAFIKALGDGLDYPLDRFDVSLAPGEPARILRVGPASGDACGWELMDFSPGPGLAGAVAMRRPGGER